MRKKLLQFEDLGNAQSLNAISYDVPSRWACSVGPPQGNVFLNHSRHTDFGHMVIKPVAALTPNELKACRGLTLEPHRSEMLKEINSMAGANASWVRNRALIRKLAEAHVILAKNKRGKLLGWALAFKNHNGLNLYMFVSTQLRRSGVGSNLIGLAEEFFPNALVHPWNFESRAFYSKFKFRLAPGRHY